MLHIMSFKYYEWPVDEMQKNDLCYDSQEYKTCKYVTHYWEDENQKRAVGKRHSKSHNNSVSYSIFELDRCG